jgi:16S rRNA (guanine966-N2)-methyltransferase
MVREAMFSALASRDRIAGARVLDLYAGSGALGLEAASRGAASVTLVDSSSAAVAACRKNAAHILKSASGGIGLSGRKVSIDVSSSPVLAYLTGARQFWDIVFLDPPYELGASDVTSALGALVPRLDPDAVVVLERGSRSGAPALPAGLQLDREKTYGDTAVYWLSLAPAVDDN